MKKFEFRLDSVLRWRDTQLQLERAKLQGLLADETRLKAGLETIATERRAAIEHISRNQVDSLDLRSLSSYMVGAEARTNMLRDQIRKRSAAVQQQRERVVLAERNVKLLVKLKEKRHMEWHADFNREIEAAAAESWLASNFRRADSKQSENGL